MEYKEILLHDLVEVYVDNRGKTCPVVDEEDSYLPLIATNCITEDLYPQFSRVRHVDKSTYDNWFRAHPQPNDIIFVNKGTPGGTALVPKKVNFCFAQDMVGLRIKEEYSTEYVFAVLRSSLMRRRIEAMQVGTLIPHFKKGDFKKLYLPIPLDLKVQKSIGKFHLDIVKKIDINKNIISNLEELAQNLFKRWFVDYEFPNENGEPYKSSGGEMVESSMGMIPNNWNKKRIGEISKEPIVCGKTPRTKIKENYGTEVPFITIPDMHNNIFILKTARYLSALGVESQPKKTVPANSISVSCIASPGLVVMTTEPSHTNQQINTFIPHETDIYFMFLYLQMLSPLIIELGSGGSTTLNLNKSQFEKITIIYPSEIYRESFHDLVKPLFEQILNMQKENEVLKSLRDTLLPKLLSREIEIPDETEVMENVPIS